MTICIAGIVENSKIIAFTDRMLTLAAPVRTAFEITENDKAKQLGDKVVGMFAGDVLKANAILNIAQAKINGAVMGVERIAAIVQDAYKEQWMSDIHDGLLQRFGLYRETFISRQRELDEELVKNINNAIGTYDLDVEIIVAGLDGARPRIFKIGNPGVRQSYDAVGYCCIGSGAQHATFSLIEGEYNPGFTEAKGIHAILQAKKRAQYDPGVGTLTDIVLINDSYVKLEEEKIYAVDEAHKQSVATIKAERERCAEQLMTLIYDR